MRVEATLLQRTSPNGEDLKPHGFLDELRSWGALFTKKYRARTAVGVLMMVFQRRFEYLVCEIAEVNIILEWSGINALLYYGPILVKSVGLSGEKVTLLVSGGIGVVQFFAVIPAISQIDRIGAYLQCAHSPWLLMQFREETFVERCVAWEVLSTRSSILVRRRRGNDMFAFCYCHFGQLGFLGLSIAMNSFLRSFCMARIGPRIPLQLGLR